MRFIINILLPIFGFFVTYTLWAENTNEGYEMYYLVPFIFSLYLLIDRNINTRIFANAGFAVFFLTAIFRFLLTPYIACISNYPILFGIEPTPGEFKEAVSLSLYEEILILLVFFAIKSKFYKRGQTECQKLPIEEIGGKKLLYLMCLLALFSVIKFPQMFKNLHFVGKLSKIDLAETIVVDIPFAGIFTEALTLGRMFAILIIFNYLYKKSKKKGKLAIFVSIAFVLINASVVNNLSRFGVIVPIISFTYLLLAIYYKQRNLIVTTMASIILAIVVGMSAVKFFSEDRNSSNYKSDDITFWGETFQTYFMGVKETAVGIHTESQIDMIYKDRRGLLFLNDTFSNVIGLSNFTIATFNTTRIYNGVYFPRSDKGQQIPPNIINGLFYFGKYWAPIYPLFFLFMLCYLDYKSRNTNNMIYKYALIYGALNSGLFMMVNGTMIICYLINDMVLMLIYAKLNNLISKMRI